MVLGAKHAANLQQDDDDFSPVSHVVDHSYDCSGSSEAIFVALYESGTLDAAMLQSSSNILQVPYLWPTFLVFHVVSSAACMGNDCLDPINLPMLGKNLGLPNGKSHIITRRPFVEIVTKSRFEMCFAPKHRRRWLQDTSRIRNTPIYSRISCMVVVAVVCVCVCVCVCVYARARVCVCGFRLGLCRCQTMRNTATRAKANGVGRTCATRSSVLPYAKTTVDGTCTATQATLLGLYIYPIPNMWRTTQGTLKCVIDKNTLFFSCRSRGSATCLIAMGTCHAQCGGHTDTPLHNDDDVSSHTPTTC